VFIFINTFDISKRNIFLAFLAIFRPFSNARTNILKLSFIDLCSIVMLIFNNQNVFSESGVNKHLLGGDVLPKKVNISSNSIQYKK